MTISKILSLKGYSLAEKKALFNLLSRAKNAPSVALLPTRNTLAGRRLLAHAKRHAEQLRMEREYCQYTDE